MPPVGKGYCRQVVDYVRGHVCGDKAPSQVETTCEGGHLLVEGPRCDKHRTILKAVEGGPCRICARPLRVDVTPVRTGVA